MVLDCKEIKPVHSEGDQPWVFIVAGRDWDRKGLGWGWGGVWAWLWAGWLELDLNHSGEK